MSPVDFGLATLLGNERSAAFNTGAPFGPDDAGFIAWNFDPNFMSSNLLLTSGRIEGHRVRLGAESLCTGAVIGINVAGATLTAGQNLVAICDAAGDRLAVSADQSGSWVSTGVKQAAWTAPITLPAGDYFVLVLAVGTTPPTLRRGDNAAGAGVNGLLTTPMFSLRGIRTSGTANTSIPDPIVEGDYIVNGTPVWVALY